MGKSFGDEYERFVNEVLEEPGLTRSDVDECLKKASKDYKSFILEGFFPFNEEKIPLTSTRATTKVDLLSLMASFNEGNTIKECYQILSFHAQNFQYGEYYQDVWNLLEEIAFDRIKDEYKISDEQSKLLMQRLCSIALDSVDSDLPEEVVEKTLETIEKQLKEQTSICAVATDSSISVSDPEITSSEDDLIPHEKIARLNSDSPTPASSSESSKLSSESSGAKEVPSDRSSDSSQGMSDL